ncbi:MAG: c-type cytochrome biogenesis protein CcmI [Pseudomonadota bacterium]
MIGLSLLLGLATLPFVLWPLLRGKAAPTGEANTRLKSLKSLYRSRREELEREAAEGLLSPEDLGVALDEHDRASLRDLEQEQIGALDSTTDTGRQAPVLAAVVAVLAVVGVYALIGEPEAEALAGAQTVLALPESAAEELADWRDTLEARVASEPDDAKSHYLLGHVALKQQRFVAAAAAFEQADRANGTPDAGIDLYWLQARFLADKGVINDRSRELANRVLERAPNQPAVLEMLAIDAMRGERFPDAVSLLNRLLGQRLGPGQRAALEAGYQQARAQLPSTPAAVDVAIDVDGKPPETATLFVIARPVGGGMPFAVVRRPGPDYPRSVRLDDLVSMNPARPLSTADAIEVVVRLSRSGRPQKQPGDWEWQSATVELAENDRPVALEAALAPPAS